MQTKALIKSMRLRTLPLSLAGVMCGAFIAMSGHGGSWWSVALVALTAVLLQILSNLSNEMGDYRSGVDNADRQGPAYGLANGLTERQLWRAINVMVVLCAVSGLAMVVVSGNPWWLLLVGAAAIWAATHYTLGKKPYGYIGLGDLFVFVFFGLVSVMGSYFVVANTIDVENWPVAPAVGMGFLSVGVLNINNMRDMATDKGFRRTIPLRVGLKGARWYQTILMILGYFGMIAYIEEPPLFQILSWLSFGGLVFSLTIVWRNEERKLDSALPVWVISTFLLAIANICAHYGI